MNITSIINLLMLVVAVTGIVVEKPWHRSENLDLKIWVAAISYDQINSEKLAEHFNVKPQVLVDKTVEMIAKNKIEGQIRFPIFYFDCPENRKRLKEKDTKSKQKNSSAPSTTKKMKKEKRTEDKIQKEKDKTPKGIPKKKIKPNSDDNSPETKTTTRKKRDLKFIKTLSAKFTIISLFLLGLFITYQAVILYLLPLLASLDPVLAEFLSGVSPPFPTLQELITNYGVTYTLIIGSYTLISAFAIKRKTDWAYGTLFTILFFIIFDNLVSLIASIINASPMDVVTFLGIIILSIALLAIAKERPWNVTRQLDYNLLASSKSYDKIKSETLASNLNVKLDYLLNRLRQLITDGKIEGSIDLSTIYFDTEKNKAKIL